MLRGLGTVLVVVILIGVGLLLGLFLGNDGAVQSLLGISAAPSINAVTVLERVQALSELTTQRYNFSSIVTSERDMPAILRPIYGERQVLVAVGYIDAGVDLSALDVNSIQIANDRLTLTLPAAALQACVLDEQQTYVASQDTGLFAPRSLTLNDDARRFALAQFQQQALETDILSEAETEARVLMTQMILALNPTLQTVSVNFTPSDPAALLPESCR